MDINNIWVSITRNCNNRCSWCYSGSGNVKGKMFLDPVRIPTLVSLIEGLQTKRVIFIGGEPTLHPNLPDFISRLSQSDTITGIVTNGRKFKDFRYVQDIQEVGTGSVTVSIEGPNRRVHDSIV